MEPLNLPACDTLVRGEGARRTIYDPLRARWVRLTPEEWVRRHFAAFLIGHRRFPAGLVKVEHAFLYQGMLRRADLVAFDRQGRPLLLAECKAPSVAITQEVFDQAARYNTVVHASYLVVTNGLEHFVCRINHSAGTIRFLDDVPEFDSL